MRTITSRFLAVALIVTALASSAWAARFSIVALPDTQNYSKSNPGIFTEQTNWIKANSSSIAFVTHLGDIVHEGWKDAQWNNALTAMNALKGHVPFGLCPGNHDLRSSEPETFDSTKFNTYFGASYFSGYSWYRGTSPSGFSSYQIITAGGYELLFLHLTCDAPDSELTWAKSVLNAHSGMPTIVTTHEYMNSSRRDRAASISGRNSGEALWNKFIRQYDQIVCVLCGHAFNPDGWHRQISINNAGRKVYEMMSDYQDIGNGWLRVLNFDTTAGTLSVKTYSTHLGAYMTDSGNQFTYDMNISARFVPDATVKVLKPKVTSSFASGMDGWTRVGDSGSTLVRKNDANGNGYLYCTDAAAGTTDFFVAPSKFRGDLSGYDAIVFDYRAFSDGDQDPTYIRLYSGSQYYQWKNNERVTNNGQWERLVASLKDADLWSPGGGATEDFASFITHITDVRLCADIVSGTEQNGLDNFSLATYQVLDQAIVASTFDSGRDGWTADADGEIGWDNHGYASGKDLGTGETWYFCAPAKFRGDKSVCFRGALQFDLKQSKVDSQSDHPDVILSGAGLTLTKDLPVTSNPNAAWTNYVIPLNEYSGWVNQATGLAARADEIMAVLSSLTSLRIRGEYRAGADSAWLDNVIMTLPNAGRVESIAEIKSLADGLSVNIANPVVVTAGSTTFSDGSFYVEQPDRSCGIRVMPMSGLQSVAVGDRITGTGMVRTDANGERYLTLTSINVSPGAPLRPVMLASRAVSNGVDPTGLLVTIWGRLVSVDPVAPPQRPGYAYIDDGSGSIKVILSGLSAPITKDVDCEGILVTGLLTLAQGENGVVPAIRPRSDNDIVTFNVD